MQDGSRLCLDGVRLRLRAAAKLTNDQYSDFWRNLKNGRDQYFARNEFALPLRPKFPDLDALAATSLEMRDIVHDVVCEQESDDHDFQKSFRELVQGARNRNYLRELEADCAYFKSAIETKGCSERN